ncbi:hypothetical protein V8C86DRAFT_2624170 [Haematococcus lacustris]
MNTLTRHTIVFALVLVGAASAQNPASSCPPVSFAPLATLDFGSLVASSWFVQRLTPNANVPSAALFCMRTTVQPLVDAASSASTSPDASRQPRILRLSTTAAFTGVNGSFVQVGSFGLAPPLPFGGRTPVVLSATSAAVLAQQGPPDAARRGAAPSLADLTGDNRMLSQTSPGGVQQQVMLGTPNSVPRGTQLADTALAALNAGGPPNSQRVALQSAAQPGNPNGDAALAVVLAGGNWAVGPASSLLKAPEGPFALPPTQLWVVAAGVTTGGVPGSSTVDSASYDWIMLASGTPSVRTACGCGFPTPDRTPSPSPSPAATTPAIAVSPSPSPSASPSPSPAASPAAPLSPSPTASSPSPAQSPVAIAINVAPRPQSPPAARPTNPPTSPSPSSSSSPDSSPPRLVTVTVVGPGPLASNLSEAIQQRQQEASQRFEEASQRIADHIQNTTQQISKNIQDTSQKISQSIRDSTDKISDHIKKAADRAAEHIACVSDRISSTISAFFGRGLGGSGDRQPPSSRPEPRQSASASSSSGRRLLQDPAPAAASASCLPTDAGICTCDAVCTAMSSTVVTPGSPPAAGLWMLTRKPRDAESVAVMDRVAREVLGLDTALMVPVCQQGCWGNDN